MEPGGVAPRRGESCRSSGPLRVNQNYVERDRKRGQNGESPAKGRINAV